MHKNSSEKFNIELNDQSNSRLVNISIPHDSIDTKSHRDTDTWISLLEQSLACDFDGYSIKVSQDNYLQTTNVSILFSTVDDAVLFKLQRTI